MSAAAGRTRLPRLFAAILASLLVMTAPPPTVAAGPLSLEQQRDALTRAIDAFDQAVAISRENSVEAERLFREAAAGFETLIASGIRNAALEYNLGNTYYRLGELGRTVLHYRRAERLDPTDANVAANLAYVRQRVRPRIETTGQQKLVERLLFWQRFTSREQRFWLAAVLSAAGWLGLLARLRWRSGALTGVAIGAVMLGVANAASVAWELHDEQSRPAAVVVQGEPVLRQGRGEGYEAVFSEPLGPGVEVRIIEQRGEWVHVELRNELRGWLPAGAVERV